MSAFLLYPLLAGALALTSPDPQALMEAVKWRADGQARQARVRLDLLDGEQVRQTREVDYLERDGARERDTLMYINQPRDVAGTSLLLQSSAERPSDEDNIYLYLPALRKSKRLAARNKRGRFVGSEFSYADLEWLRPEDFRYRRLGEARWQGRPVVHLEAVASDDRVLEKTGYSKKELWVDPDYALVVRGLYFDEQGRQLKQMEVEEVTDIQGFWTITRQVVHNLQTGKGTRMWVDEVRYDPPVNDRLFTKQQLGRAW